MDITINEKVSLNIIIKSNMKSNINSFFLIRKKEAI